MLTIMSGCGGPFRLGPSMPAGMDALVTASQDDHSGAGVSAGKETDASQTPDDGGLKVGDAVIAPEDVWKDHLGELRGRARVNTPSQFRRWLIQRSGALITDRIAESLLYQEASSQLGDKSAPGIQNYIDGEIRKIVTEKYDGIQRRYEKALEKTGTTLEAVRKKLRRQAIIGAYLENKVRNQVPEPTRNELYEEFERQREAMRRPGGRSMSLIDIRIDKFYPKNLLSPTRGQTEEARFAARREALAALHDLHDGVPFAEVARLRSHGLHAQDGGKWGWISIDAVRKRFRPAVAAMQRLSKGEISELIEVPDGFFIVRCDDIQEAFEPNFVNVQPLLHQRIVDQRYNQAIGAEVERLRRKAGIDGEALNAFHRRVVKVAQRQVDDEKQQGSTDPVGP